MSIIFVKLYVGISNSGNDRPGIAPGGIFEWLRNNEAYIYTK